MWFIVRSAWSLSKVHGLLDPGSRKTGSPEKQRVLCQSYFCIANLQGTPQFPEVFGCLPQNKVSKDLWRFPVLQAKCSLRHSRPNLSALGVVRPAGVPVWGYKACLHRSALTQLGRKWTVWWQCPEHSALLQKLSFHCSLWNNGVLALTATNWLYDFFLPETILFSSKKLQARDNQHFSGAKSNALSSKYNRSKQVETHLAVLEERNGNGSLSGTAAQVSREVN